jgi:hypothetical protein
MAACTTPGTPGETMNVGMDEIPPQFAPLHRPPSWARVAVLLAGPLLWLGSLLAVAFVVEQLDDVGVAVLITAVSFAISIPALLLARRRCVRDERKAQRADAG